MLCWLSSECPWSLGFFKLIFPQKSKSSIPRLNNASCSSEVNAELSSTIDSGEAGSARAPLEFGGSEKGQSLISTYWSLAITTNTPKLKKLSTVLIAIGVWHCWHTWIWRPNDLDFSLSSYLTQCLFAHYNGTAWQYCLLLCIVIG